jgi:hypothetical protein
MKSTKSIITNKIFRQFLRNVDLEEGSEEREIYEQKYLASLGFNKEETYSIKTSLGIEFNKGVNYLFSPNPFLNDPDVMNNITISPNENKHLGKVDDNCIYACLAKDVFEYAGDFAEMYSRMYFPNLQAKNIFNLNDLHNKQGIEYIACAVSSIRRNEAPWNLTGFQKFTEEKRRSGFIIKPEIKFSEQLLYNAI